MMRKLASLLGLAAVASSAAPHSAFGADRKDARSMAMRDPALAAALGIGGDQFGHESNFGDMSYFGHQFGYDFGDDAAAAPAAPPAGAMAMRGGVHPVHQPQNAAAAQAVWNKAAKRSAATSKRVAELFPNQDSDIQVERYSFSINQALTLGTALASFTMQGSPDVTTRPQRVIFNAPAPGFAYISDIKVTNVSVLIGGGNLEDAYTYSSVAVDSRLDVPTINPQNKIIVPGQYTGFTPSGYSPGGAYILIATFRGPSVVTGQTLPTQ